MSASAGNMTTMLSGSFGTLIQGLGATAEAFLTTGKLSGRALATLLTQTLAHLAVESGIKALYELAAGYASAAIYDYDAAAKHFAAASFYGEVAAIAGAGAVASRLAFGTATTSAASAQGVGAGGGDGSGSNAPAYAPFNYGQPSFSASQAGTPGSRTDNLFTELIKSNQQVVASNNLVAAHVAALRDKIDSVPGGDLIRANPYAVGDSLQAAFQGGHEVKKDVISLGSRGVA